MTDTYSTAEAAYIVSVTPRQLAHLARHPALNLDCEAARADHRHRRYSHADLYSVALLHAARKAGFKPRQRAAVLPPGRSGLACLIAGMQSDPTAASLDLPALKRGIEARRAETLRWRSRLTDRDSK